MPDVDAEALVDGAAAIDEDAAAIEGLLLDAMTAALDTVDVAVVPQKLVARAIEVASICCSLETVTVSVAVNDVVGVYVGMLRAVVGETARAASAEDCKPMLAAAGIDTALPTLDSVQGKGATENDGEVLESKGVETASILEGAESGSGCHGAQPAGGPRNHGRASTTDNNAKERSETDVKGVKRHMVSIQLPERVESKNECGKERVPF